MIQIRPALPEEFQSVYELVTQNHEWPQFNGPYFPYQTPTAKEFKHGVFNTLLQGESMQLITLNDVAIGSVSYYWECESTRWLEIGVILYDRQYWGKGYALPALRLWVTSLFNSLKIARVGLTTWSGNPRMMKCAEKLGMQQEARLRKVRFYNECYYDSVKYGVLRDEWNELERRHLQTIKLSD